MSTTHEHDADETPERIAFTFYTGTHKPTWLKRAGVPLFVSDRELAKCVALPRALARWACDSSGFTEVTQHGGYRFTARQYVTRLRRYVAEIGMMDFASAMDWMCEPIGTARTGLTVYEHQKRTIANYIELRTLAPELPIAPVVQGWNRGDYLRCVDMYAAAGIFLQDLPVVGIGSVCRRENTDMAEGLVAELAGIGLRLHAFGFKRGGVARAWRHLASADSLAWSFAARKQKRKGALCTHPNCSNCIAEALRARHAILRGAVGVYDACPDCGSCDVAPALAEDPFYRCTDCGAEWPEYVAHHLGGLALTGGRDNMAAEMAAA